MKRKIFPINHGWLFSKYKKDSYKPNYRNPDFEKVTLPHSNKILPWHSFNDKDYQFISIYRRKLKLNSKFQSKRIFVDFEGVMTAADVYVNGEKAGSHKGGFTGFSIELTKFLNFDGKDLLAVKVDSRELPDIPPFGNRLDYLTFGGIYRQAWLRVVEKEYIREILAVPLDAVKKLNFQIDYQTEINRRRAGVYSLNIKIKDKRKIVYTKDFAITNNSGRIIIKNLRGIKLWDINNPYLYGINVSLIKNNSVIDDYCFKTGFRDCKFKKSGFYLNNKKIKLIGVNRHQTYPYIGAAAPAKLQCMDADIIKNELKCNIVRTSHYPQSRHFLDRCDKIGLLVFEEIPGWQHIGGDKWKKNACKSVEEMIKTDIHHPSIILWGTRINESIDCDDFYKKTNDIAHKLDSSRQTGGVRKDFDSKLVEDVFTINDFNLNGIQPPNHEHYLITEFCGHMYPTKTSDPVEQLAKHALHHANINSEINSHKGIAGAIAWSSFDYNTHADFGSGNRICHHGLYDMFRIPKPAAFFYKSQCAPSDELVLEPTFYWCIGDWPGGGLPEAVFMSNCDILRIYLNDKLIAIEKPHGKKFPHLKHPPFICDKISESWGKRLLELRVDGYVKNKKVITKKFCAKGIDSKFNLILDHKTLIANGADMTRLAFTVSDKYGNIRPSTSGSIKIKISGPGQIIGENPFALSGGRGCVFIKSTQKPGIIEVKLSHPVLGSKKCKIKTVAAPREKI